jgi:hypothetical protein
MSVTSISGGVASGVSAMTGFLTVVKTCSSGGPRVGLGADAAHFSCPGVGVNFDAFATARNIRSFGGKKIPIL